MERRTNLKLRSATDNQLRILRKFRSTLLALQTANGENLIVSDALAEVNIEIDNVYKVRNGNHSTPSPADCQAS